MRAGRKLAWLETMKDLNFPTHRKDSTDVGMHRSSEVHWEWLAEDRVTAERLISQQV